MTQILLWGVVSASSLFLGALLALARDWHRPTIGRILAFGAGALIASVSLELAEEGVSTGGAVAVGVGLALGAAAYFTANRVVERRGGGSGGGSGAALTVGALLDGIPEQVVLGVGLAAGGEISLALVVAIFVSNLPEAIGSSADLLRAGKTRRHVLTQWSAVTVICILATVVGGLLAELATPGMTAGVQGFAAGALLVMLIDTMIPEAREQGGETAGLVTVVGFALACGLSLLG